MRAGPSAVPPFPCRCMVLIFVVSRPVHMVPAHPRIRAAVTASCVSASTPNLASCFLQLVRAREGDGSYVPIPEGDVAAARMPPLREPDAYLKSRLDQFYAELQARALS
jgi:hypothetical protein